MVAPMLAVRVETDWYASPVNLVIGMPSASAFARIFQFGMRLGMRSYTIGSAWWQGDCGPYWGHNAVLRLDLARELTTHCLVWWPQRGDRFVVPDRDMDEEVFVVSDLTVDVPGVPLRVAVMGCVVNGPGEARDADIGIAAGNKRGHLFVKGRNIAVVPEDEMVEALVEWASREDLWILADEVLPQPRGPEVPQPSGDHCRRLRPPERQHQHTQTVGALRRRQGHVVDEVELDRD